MLILFYIKVARTSSDDTSIYTLYRTKIVDNNKVLEHNALIIYFNHFNALSFKLIFCALLLRIYDTDLMAFRSPPRLNNKVKMYAKLKTCPYNGKNDHNRVNDWEITIMICSKMILIMNGRHILQNS